MASEGNSNPQLCLLFRFSKLIMMKNYYPLILRGNTSSYRLSFHTLITLKIQRRKKCDIIAGAPLLI